MCSLIISLTIFPTPYLGMLFTILSLLIYWQSQPQVNDCPVHDIIQNKLAPYHVILFTDIDGQAISLSILLQDRLLGVFLRTALMKVRKFFFFTKISSIKGHLTSKVVFNQRSSSIKGHLSSKFVFMQRSSSIKVRLSSKVVFLQRWSFFKGRLQSKVIFRQRSSSIKGRLPSKVIFHQRCLPSRVVLF